MPTPSIAVIGSGSLARALCYSLAVGPQQACVTLIARSAGRAAEIAYIGGARATLSTAPVTFTGRVADLADVDAVAQILATASADVVVNCASHHSPWERKTMPSPWTDLLDEAGFGITLPLQTQPVITVARAVGMLTPQPILINACFPDAVNPLLHALGLPVLCGVGNIAVLATTLAAALDVKQGQDLRVLGHHAHLYPPRTPDDEAMAWLDGTPVTDVTGLLAPQRAADRAELNHVTGHGAAQFLRGLLSGAELRTHVPGPLGLPGGYPVVLRERALTLDLPDGLSEAAATSWNQRAALVDGVQVIGDRVQFTPRGSAALHEHIPQLSSGFDVQDVGAVLDRLIELRDRLRRP